MIPVRFHRDAQEDVRQALTWYESQARGLGDTFLEELVHAVTAIQTHPLSRPVYLDQTRLILLRRFPFGIVYVYNQSLIDVVAVMHLRKRPGYWRQRLSQSEAESRETLMNRVDNAVDMFAQGFNCSQSVFCAFAESMGLDRQTALKAASGFGGGMGAMGAACGAVTGAFMALGLKFGHTSPQDKAAKQRIYGMIKDFAARFKAAQGALDCRDLLGFEIGTPQGQKLAAERDIHHKVCPKFVRAAAEILAQMLA